MIIAQVLVKWRSWIVTLPVVILFSCGPSIEDRDTEWHDSLIAEAMSLAEPGDLLLRSGKSYASQQIRDLSTTAKEYSHAGIVVEVNGRLKICSIEPIDDTSPTDSIRYDDPYRYLDPSHNYSFALYRYSLPENERKTMLGIIENYYSKGVVFDHLFIYETDDKLYCSEMISKALDSATNGRIRLPRTIITNPSSVNSIVRHFKKFGLTKEQVSKRPVILMDNVYRHPECNLIKHFDFRP